MGYSYEIHYKPGKENVVVDALSRVPSTPIFSAILSPTTDVFQQLQQFFTSHSAGQQLPSDVQSDVRFAISLFAQATSIESLFRRSRIYPLPPAASDINVSIEEVLQSPVANPLFLSGLIPKLGLEDKAPFEGEGNDRLGPLTAQTN
ncbi:hypothetical protein Salat_2930300 [Sesamum alatum]|uniref:Uncharacterized protein n=1 Tax=Sesamum alatum TaxID=300844 RepID=A0AAE1XJY5_9LAMI|nr:hypothetical protein Salat_2930300 [Sesamum alatum]